MPKAHRSGTVACSSWSQDVSRPGGIGLTNCLWAINTPLCRTAALQLIEGCGRGAAELLRHIMGGFKPDA